MTKTYDAIVIGAGHNGLICASYLAKAGKSVLIVEANEQVGGAAITREFAPFFKVSAGAHLLHLLRSEVLSDLGIKLDLGAENLKTVALAQSGHHITLTKDSAGGIDMAADDIAAYPKFKTRMLDFAETLAPLMMKKPPRIGKTDLDDVKTGIKLGWDIRVGLGKEKMQDFLRIVGINIFDVLNEVFDNDLVKGALSFDAVIGTHMGPRTPTTVLSYLYRLTGEANGNGLSLPKGGMGAVTAALADVAQKSGAQIKLSSPVAKIVTADGVATGVELANGEALSASIIVSNADPKTTFLKLLGARHLEAGFAHRINKIRMRGSVAKLHLALDGLPKFKGVDPRSLGQRLVIAPTMQHVERAFDHSKYGEMSNEPVMEIVIPTLHDESLAPGGKHVLSANILYAPYDLRLGWDGGKDLFANKALDTLERYAPGLRDLILHQELLTPVDLEDEFHMTGGHWHHGEFGIDQLLMMRPTYGAAQYKTPMPGLYLCGAGAHPGGGIMGAAGHNAAKTILRGEAK